jgi:RimJ/RimL family protein N-acetyltransferase
VLVRLGQEVQEVPRRLTPPDPPLTAGSIRLEPLAQRDVDDAFRMAQDADVRRFTYLPSSADRAWLETWIARYEDGWADGSLAGFSIRDTADGDFLGFAAIVRLDLDAAQGEIGYMLSRAARGRGAAAHAVRLLTDWGFAGLGLERLELRIDHANDASKRVAERAGYRLEGVLRSLAFKEGRRTDTGVWSRLRGDPPPG